jgi:hypothetical protein
VVAKRHTIPDFLKKLNLVGSISDVRRPLDLFQNNLNVWTVFRVGEEDRAERTTPDFFLHVEVV